MARFQQKAFILENRACSKCVSKRHFGLGYEVPMHSDKEKALLPAFYDFQDNVSTVKVISERIMLLY